MFEAEVTFHECSRTHRGSDYWQMFTQKVPKEALFNWLQIFWRCFWGSDYWPISTQKVQKEALFDWLQIFERCFWGSDYWPISTQKVPKEALSNRLQIFERCFKKNIWCNINSRPAKIRSEHTYEVLWIHWCVLIWNQNLTSTRLSAFMLIYTEIVWQDKQEQTCF